MEGTPPMSSYEDETGVKLIIIIIIIISTKNNHGGELNFVHVFLPKDLYFFIQF